MAPLLINKMLHMLQKILASIAPFVSICIMIPIHESLKYHFPFDLFEFYIRGYDKIDSLKESIQYIYYVLNKIFRYKKTMPHFINRSFGALTEISTALVSDFGSIGGHRKIDPHSVDGYLPM
ncbi:hypothetical protein GQ457_07G018870 [Hibiscus cannabinus]